MALSLNKPNWGLNIWAKDLVMIVKSLTLINELFCFLFKAIRQSSMQEKSRIS